MQHTLEELVTIFRESRASLLFPISIHSVSVF